MHRHGLSDEQWRKIESLLHRHGRRPMRGDRSYINAVLYLMKTGCPWRDLADRAIVHFACAMEWFKQAA
jgi:transposase